jgi:Flp pilus assembly protein TadD
MKTLRSLLLLAPVVALVSGCAGRKQGVDPTPSWATDEGKAEARVDLVRAMLDAHNPEAALVLAASIRAEGKATPELDVIQAEALRETGLYDDAEDMLKDHLRRHPRDGAAQNQLGILLMDRKRVEEAAQAFERATRLVPGEPDYANNLGFALMSIGKPDEAVIALRTALKLDGSRNQTRNNLGFALVAAKREDEAMRVFKAAVGEVEARYNVALGLELRGDLSLAKDAYGTVLKSDPHHERALDALRRLEAPSNPPPQEQKQ